VGAGSADDLREWLRPAIDALRNHRVVAYPTDTLYGLGADPRSSAAMAKIFAAKRRPQDQPIPLIAGSRAHVDDIGRLTPLGIQLAEHFWPGPLTLIVTASPDLCPEVHRGTGKVAVRIPDHAVARALSNEFGYAITSTSANLSGARAAVDADEVLPIEKGIAVLIDGGPAAGGLPSTIVDVTGSAPILVRAGAVPWERVLKFLR